MPVADSESLTFDPALFETNLDLDLNYGTPHLAPIDSQGWPLAENQGQDGLGHQSGVWGSLTYNVVWKLQLRKGRMMLLTGDTVEDVSVAPGTYWSDTFKSDIDEVVKERVPEPQYKPDETRITVSTSKRGQRDFQKRFGGLNIDWVPVGNKLQSWGNGVDRLTLEICFIFKEVPVDPTNKVGKSGRGATARQLAARDKYVAQQEAAGIRPVWKDIYELFECTSVVCPNRGFSCWREPSTKKHHKLDTDIMEKLVEYAEDGNKVETQDDIPERIRELIWRHEEEEQERKRLKRKATDPPMPTISVYCHGGCDGPGKKVRHADPGPLKLPMPPDQAPESYCDWLCSQVTDIDWLAAYRLARRVMVSKGYTLGQLDKDQAVKAKMLFDNGVLEGIAEQFVERIREWLSDIASE